MASYKTCAVPMCESSTIKCPNKLFIHVPRCTERRKQWLQLARRDPQFTSDKSTIFFCEDHFDLSKDMENHIQYTVMGSVGKIKMKRDCLPSKFACQPGRSKRKASPQPQSVGSKKLCMDTMQEILSNETQIPSISGMTSRSYVTTDTCREYSLNFQDQETQVCPETTEKSIQVFTEITDKLIQVNMSAKFRSKALQIASQTKDKNTSPLKTNVLTTATSPIKIKSRLESRRVARKKILFSEKIEMSSSNSSSPAKHSQLNTESSPSIQTSLIMTSTSSDQEIQSELSEIRRKIETDNLHKMSLENSKQLIRNNPRYYYIGVSKECYFVTEIIEKHTKLPEEHILMCLKKIRLNTPFLELGDQFGMSLSYASKIFMKSVPLIANVLHPFIIKSNISSVKKNLPMAFRHKYHNVYCIIDCLEIEIQKPSKSVEQALTWSEYKKANTAKYLISSTPDGIINYISPGYGGRTTDVVLLENCNFLDCLEPGISILADRGFKHVEELLLQKGISLIRPPSVPSGTKLCKKDAIKTKQIASLRIHIERIIRRLREFSMLKPHSVVNKKMLKYLDKCVVIACALINLQDSIIKNT